MNELIREKRQNPSPADGTPTCRSGEDVLLGERQAGLSRHAPLFFFLSSLLLLSVCIAKFVTYSDIRLPTNETFTAHKPVDVFTLSRLQIVDFGRLSYAVLGLGQDPQSGSQIVWVRSLVSHRTEGFAAGERLFGSPIRVHTIGPEQVIFQHHTKKKAVTLEL